MKDTMQELQILSERLENIFPHTAAAVSYYNLDIDIRDQIASEFSRK